MSTTTAQRVAIVPQSPPSTPRVCLVPTRTGRAVLDGGWWPRSCDPVAELPGLILSLNERYGPIRQVMLNSTAWDSRFRRLMVGPRAVRTGWFTSLDPALVIATTDSGDQVDLLVVPPSTAEGAARAAMARAADPTNTMRAPQILAAIPAAADRAPAGLDADAGSAWDNEGRSPRRRRPTPDRETPPRGEFDCCCSPTTGRTSMTSAVERGLRNRDRSAVEHAQTASRSDERDR
jgi:Family of unknown function (DUF5994)